MAVTESQNEFMQLRRPLPPLIRKELEARGAKESDVIIATNTDLDIVGEYSERWLVVLPREVLVFMIEEDDGEAHIIRELPVDRIETARTDVRVGSGFLEAKTKDDVYEELIRFSNRNADKFSRVAMKIRTLAAGRKVEVSPEEEVELRKGRCHKCGVLLADRSMTICPKCLKRGLVFLRFLMRTKTYWPSAVLAMILVVLTIIISLVPPLLQQILIDNVFSQGQPLPGWFAWMVNATGILNHYEWLYLLVASLVAARILSTIITIARERIAVTISNRLALELRRDVFTKLEDLDVRYYDLHPVGQLMTRVTQDIEVLQSFVNQLTSGFGYQIILLFMVTIAMFTMNWQLTLVAIIPTPAVMFSTVLFYRYIIPHWHRFWTTRSNLSNVLHASLSGIRVVKAFAQEKREQDRFEGYSGKYAQSGLNVGYPSAVFYPIMGFVFELGQFFIWVIGGRIILAGLEMDAVVPELTAGKLIAFLGYLGMFYGPLNSLTQMSNWFTQFTTQAHRVFEILDAEPEITETRDNVEVEIQGAIEFHNVTFGYDPHIPVLHEVSFKIQQGEMLGIVGHSGSGKSTTVNLIMRFYDPVDGKVTIDNIDVRRLRRGCLRRQIGIVLQDPFLFRGTIADNISYGNPDVAPEQVLDAALAANGHMFITRFHDGYDTRLGESGSGLSGGERQRVAIARALLHNPRILILDEATSSVDTIAEREIQNALEALSWGRTVIAIAHRLSTLRNCDRILVFEEGYIREQGSHEELLELGGIYKKLVEIQTQLSSDHGNVDGLAALDELKKAEEKAKPAEAKIAAASGRNSDRKNREVPHIRYLEPKDLSMHALEEGGMKVVYRDEVYEHVHAYRCFPITRPSEFIALWTGNSALEHRQIGMIRRASELAPGAKLAIEIELAKRYFIHYIDRINSIKEDVGFLTWDVETDKGHMEFLTKRWERNTVFEGGHNARVILDVDNNRYEIESLDTLDEESRAMFFRYIYW